MTRHGWIKRDAGWAACGAAVAALSGCSLLGFESIQFTNVSETWLNVRFYSGESKTQEGAAAEMVSRHVYQIAPGASARFSPPRELVHIQVETVSPTWEPPGTQYWLELMTHPPVHIVATGKAERLDFQTGSGEVAIIPDRERNSGRFEYVKVERRRPEPAAQPTPKPTPTPKQQQVAAPDK